MANAQARRSALDVQLMTVMTTGIIAALPVRTSRPCGR
jgi:hypothetical protein